MTGTNWMDRAKEEDLSGGASLVQGDNFLYFDEILTYDRVEDEYEGKPTLRFKLLFKNEDRDPLYLPKSVFKRFREELEKGMDGVRITRDGKGIDTKYTTTGVKKPQSVEKNYIE